MKKYHTVTFLPENKVLKVEDLKTIFETIELENPYGIELNFSRCCGAEGICQKCKVRALQKMGPLTPTEKGCLSGEELSRGIRLSCQARVIQDTQVEIINKQHFSVKVVDEHPAGYVDLQPRVKKIFVKSADDLGAPAFSETARQEISAVMHTAPAGCTAVLVDGEFIALEQGDTSRQLFAAAIDLGINTLMISLVDLTTGKSIAVVSDTNPQYHISEDLETRISLSLEDPLQLEMLNEEILLRIDVLLHELCQVKNVSPQNIYEITVSAPSGMLHLFLKAVPGVLEQHAAFDEGQRVIFPAQDASIKSSPSAKIYTLPGISSYVGADVTAGILATRLHRSGETTLLLDIGTTCKAVLYHDGKIIAASVAAGEAFEGIGIRFGMRPETGAVERVAITRDVHIEVIGESLPRGICGSGLIELAAGLIRENIINEQGDFTESASVGSNPAIKNRVIDTDDGKSFLLYRDEGEFDSDIYVTRDDLQGLGRAKAHLAVAVKLLLEHAGISFESVAQVLIGGAFGYHIDVGAFIGIGLFPEALQGKVSFVGNTAKAGAHLALLDKTILEEAEVIARAVESYNPQDDPRFASLVEDALNFRFL
jgi:uncharacterized 2Fe-2S/4Fe-4S cluster protein (DUF4445 family)